MVSQSFIKVRRYAYGFKYFDIIALVIFISKRGCMVGYNLNPAPLFFFIKTTPNYPLATQLAIDQVSK